MDYFENFNKLSEVYDGDEDYLKNTTSRYTNLAELFKNKFNTIPELYARAPGRVNIIGEHIDYEGYAVFPMAISQDTIVAISKGGDELSIANSNSSKYETCIFEMNPDQKVDTENHKWANYFLAAYKGVFEYLKSKNITIPKIEGLKVMIDGIIPLGSGLSSSSALVCASTIAILAVYDVLKMVSKTDIAEFTCKCERYVGTESGGMDQAISIMARSGKAKLIEFNPVRGQDVNLPDGCLFVIANSLAPSPKVETAPQNYNLRVVECRLAAVVAAAKLGCSKEEIMNIETLKDTEVIIKNKDRNLKSVSIAYLSFLLEDEAFTEKQIDELLGFPVFELFGNSLSAKKVFEHVKSTKGFELLRRAIHVFSESQRVLFFKDACESLSTCQEGKIKLLSGLMTESHNSCRDMYDCSCPELEELVRICMESGALGCRLTGAGWGGCTVSMIHEADVSDFIKQVKQKFYQKRIDDGLIKEEQLDECIFASKPCSGAAIIKF